MIKIFFTGHWHLRENQPVNRTDDIMETQFRKVETLLRQATNEKALIVHNGDLFHKWDMSYDVVIRLVNLLKKYQQVIYLIPGSHDLNGHTIEGTPFELLKKLDYFKHIETLKIGDLVSIKGLPLGAFTPDRYQVDKTCALNFILTHDMILTAGAPFPHLLTSNIDTNADLVLGSDSHIPYYQGKFINAGCLNRWTISERLIQPRAYLIEITEQATFSVVEMPLLVKTDVFREQVPKVEATEVTQAVTRAVLEDLDVKRSLEQLLLDVRDTKVVKRSRDLLEKSITEVSVG